MYSNRSLSSVIRARVVKSVIHWGLDDLFEAIHENSGQFSLQQSYTCIGIASHMQK